MLFQLQILNLRGSGALFVCLLSGDVTSQSQVFNVCESRACYLPKSKQMLRDKEFILSEILKGLGERPGDGAA